MYSLPLLSRLNLVGGHSLYRLKIFCWFWTQRNSCRERERPVLSCCTDVVVVFGWLLFWAVGPPSDCSLAPLYVYPHILGAADQGGAYSLFHSHYSHSPWWKGQHINCTNRQVVCVVNLLRVAESLKTWGIGYAKYPYHTINTISLLYYIFIIHLLFLQNSLQKRGKTAF